MWKKQDTILQSSTDADLMTSDVGLRMETLQALQLWDPIIDGLRRCPQVGKLST